MLPDAMPEAAGAAHDLVREAAVAWFVRLQSDVVSEAEHIAFAAWLAADPLHGAEYRRLGGIWRDLDALPDPRANVARQAAWQRAMLTPSRRRLLLGGGALAAASVVVAYAGLGRQWPVWLAGDMVTGTGERRSFDLADGSRVDLDAGSALKQSFSPAERRLTLLEGRARFSVVAEHTRPFVVACENGTVQALATAFVVHRRAGSVAVAVQQGSVQVTLPMQQLRLNGGQAIAYDAAGLQPAQRQGDEAETAWLRGKLIFEDRPLGDVVADLNRYRKGMILLRDEKLASLRVNGLFDLHKPDAALEALAVSLPLRLQKIGGFLALLHPA